jgi:phage tail sheath gpL-like
MASVTLTGLASNDPVPGTYVEVNFAQGPASTGTSAYSVVLLANKLSTGSATVGTVVYGPDTSVQMASETDAINLFGAGSEAHRMVRRFFAINRSTPLYVVCVAESAGASATGTVTLTGPATSNGSVRVFVGDDFVDAAFASGDSVTTMAAAVAAAVNSKSAWAATAGAALGVVTLTAKQKGPRGNQLKFWATLLPSSGTGVAVTTGAAPAYMTGGTTADTNATALATIANSRYYYQVSAAEDATQLGALVTQIGSNAAPTLGLRCRAVGGSLASIAATTTIAVGLNAARAELVWSEGAELTAGELAASAAAAYALFEAGSQLRCNFSGFGTDAVTQPFWPIKAPINVVPPSRTSLVSALNNGITPVGINKSATSIVKRITTRSTSSGVADYRIRDSHKVSVADRYADDLQTKAALQLSGKSIGNDPAAGQRVPGPTVATPRVYKALIDQLTLEYANNDLLENEGTIMANTLVSRETSPTTRLSARVPLDIIDILDQTATAIDQVG